MSRNAFADKWRRKEMGKIKNLHLIVGGMITSDEVFCKPCNLNVLITNDENGKTLSINDGEKQFSIPFEPIERFLK